MLFLSPLPVALTWENLPHTGRVFHVIVFAVLTGALGVFDVLLRGGVPRWLPLLLAGGVLLEGAQDIRTYFGHYATEADRVHPMDDEWRGDALQIAFAARHGEEPLYVPEFFFDYDGAYLDFYGDLDPVRRRTEGLTSLGIFNASVSIDATRGGILIVPYGSPPAAGDLLGTTPPRRGKEPAWQVYRLQTGAPASSEAVDFTR
jgi:hypothetical protein